MYQTDSTRSVPHLWLSLRDLLLSIYTLSCKLYRYKHNCYVFLFKFTFQLILL